MNAADAKLEITAITSTCVQGKDAIKNETDFLNALRANVKEACFIVAWFNHEVIWGRYVNRTCIWPQDIKPQFHQFIEARVFNDHEELWLHGNQWRYRQDGVENAAQNDVVDYTARLWGENPGQMEQGFVCLHDAERKVQMQIPVDVSSKNYNLQVRSYIVYNEETGQAGYGDYRFVSIREGRDE